MAAATDERGGEPLLSTTSRMGRNIFLSNHLRDSPMSQLKLPAKLCSELVDYPSPVEECVEDDTLTTAYALARDYIRSKVDGLAASTPTTEAARTLRRVGDELIDRHQTVVNAVSKRLRYSGFEDERYQGHTLSERIFVMVAEQMCSDRQENWGRVVSLFVLGAILALNNEEEENGEDIEIIIDFVGKYVGKHKRKWIESNGGWDGFVRFFDNGASDERKVWKGLLFAGISLASFANAVTRQ